VKQFDDSSIVDVINYHHSSFIYEYEGQEDHLLEMQTIKTPLIQARKTWRINRYLGYMVR